MALAYEDWYLSNDEYRDVEADDGTSQLIDETEEEYRERIRANNPFYF